ncbi:ceramide-1-phosphate transfer protein-like isoform X2 [Varroa jacobsoni]|uniref:Glycolipid transfer protein domain-containing protein n=1 Tax=Varroa destructor TaxID=109461 RepID=A0A7M7JI78_VARDE|nr:ceramide-1-phosphate transfer protein-like isoform X2 [Varroa destructor]XP_022693277.1 ceramide-1-phosphate transfer protein-like isoform X2 [Varroa jacobsoni]
MMMTTALCLLIFSTGHTDGGCCCLEACPSPQPLPSGSASLNHDLVHPHRLRYHRPQQQRHAEQQHHLPQQEQPKHSNEQGGHNRGLQYVEHCQSSLFQRLVSAHISLMHKYAGLAFLLIVLVGAYRVSGVRCSRFKDYNEAEQRVVMAVTDASEPDGFRLATVNEELIKSLSADDDILLDSYLGAFREVCKIFKEMGTVFNFVTSDLEDKIKILEEYRARNDVAEHFNSLSSMMSYEIRTGAISIRQPPSGCRTWLRLHRALQFVTMFFYRLASVDFKEKMTSLAQDCYEQTLAKYHGYLIRKGASLAMYALPTVEAMFLKARDNKADVRPLLLSVGDNAARVYNLTQKLYKQHGLLDLP